MHAEKPGEELQVIIKNEAEFIHLYRSAMEAVDPLISVTKIDKNILL